MHGLLRVVRNLILTFQQCIDGIYDNNLNGQINNFLTNTFQNQISPVDGSSYTTQFNEDSSESFTGFGAANNIFTILGDSTRAATALTNQADMASGVYNLFSVIYNIFSPEYGLDPGTFANNPDIGYYPYMQNQIWPELNQVSSIADDQKQQVRAWIYGKWPNFISDIAKDTTPAAVFGYMAARFWQDPVKAHQIVNIIERNFIANNSLNIMDFSYYLLTKDYLISPNQITHLGLTKMILHGRGTEREVCHTDHFISQAVVTATTPGTVVGKMQVWDQYSNSLGYIPIYNAIT